MEEDFLAENNPCGQNLLQLVSRGNAVIAELLRLKDNIPSIFRLSNKSDQQKYGEVILEFNYFHSSEAIDKKIETSDRKLQWISLMDLRLLWLNSSEHYLEKLLPELSMMNKPYSDSTLTSDAVGALREVSDEITEQYGDILVRLYNAYESIYKYISDLNSFIDEVEEGIYIQQTLETIFLSEDGLQLMCESIYLYGVMLLILEIYHTSPVRERLVVAYSRYNITEGTLDHVCHLVRSTGFTNSLPSKKPLNYPQDLFKRIPVNEKLLNMIIGKLRTEDIYHQQRVLPAPHHSTTAFAQQAAMLFVTLFFAPNILHNQTARMREIVDKFFPDNWIVNIYMGVTVNLIEIWEPFKAAKMALANTLEASNIKEYTTLHAKNLEKLLPETSEVLSEGVLDKQYLMENINKTLTLVRECNFTLRWLLLHTSQQQCMIETVKRCKQVRDQVLSEVQYNENKILQLLFNTSKLENRIRDIFQSVLDERSTNWEQGKKDCAVRLQELTEIFAGTKQVMRVKKSESLRKWFEEISVEIESLDLEEPNISARKVAQLVQALDEVQGFRQMNYNLGVKQLASECCELLKGMLGAVNVRDTLLVHLQMASDFSYGWLLIDSYNQLMQSLIKEDPTTVKHLRAVFLKMSSAMETPLLRINQADDGDLPSVSAYYSHQLLTRMKKLLQVIPKSVFKLMAEIAQIQTSEIPEIPPRLEKDRLKEFACLPARFKVAKLTDKVSAFCRGLLMMESTLVGIVHVDPKELLESGIREELSAHIKSALEAGLHFSPKLKGTDLKSKLDELSTTMEGHKNSFEYVQDYIGLNGVKMWQEELKETILESVEAECKCLQKKNPPFEILGNTFMGRLAKQLLLAIDPKGTMFIEHESAWADCKSKLKVVDLNLFKTILKALSVPGLVGIERITSVLATKYLLELTKFIQKEANNNKAWLEMFSGIAKTLSPYTLTIEQPAKVYGGAVTRLSRLFAAANIYETLSIIGNLQILRKQVAFVLNQSAKTRARHYTSSLLTLNEAILYEVKEHEKDKAKPMPTEGELANIAEMLTWIGANEPYSTIFITSRSVPYLSLFLFLFTTTQAPRFFYEKSLATHLCKKTGECWFSFVVGLHTFLKQYNPKIVKQYFLLSSQYAKSHMLTSALSGKQEIPQEALSMMYFLDDLVRVGGHPRSLITDNIPDVIVDLFKHGISAFVNG